MSSNQSVKFSLATNVCATDGAMLQHTLPSWLRVFGERLTEVVVVVDERPPSGRIASQRGHIQDGDDLLNRISRICELDPRVRCVRLNYDCVPETSLKWFGQANIVRCQSGTPIFAFVQAVEEASSDIVLRTDCDMLFCESGWLNEAIEALQSDALDLVEPPKLGMHLHGYETMVSTGTFMLKRSRFLERCLPLKVHHLDWARRFHRILKGRPSWLSLEEMFKKEKERGRIRHALLDSSVGFSVHVYTREYAQVEYFGEVISKIESGLIPDEQMPYGWNLTLEVWPQTNLEYSSRDV
ncbi:MAG TPA: hypothetical protein VMZ30_07045 [Pyrinomonadaceae bacterium]|nr:hypothetical protein [Pyrinomonadaceae bacterium]